MIVLIDNGHGANTPGKCSPDKQFREHKNTRESASLLEQKLKEKGITAIRIVTEENDVPLKIGNTLNMHDMYAPIAFDIER